MRNLSRVAAVLTVALSTGCPLLGPKDGTSGTDGADGAEPDHAPPAKSETGETGAKGDTGATETSNDSSCQDELDRAMAGATAKFDECKAGAN